MASLKSNKTTEEYEEYEGEYEESEEMASTPEGSNMTKKSVVPESTSTRKTKTSVGTGQDVPKEDGERLSLAGSQKLGLGLESVDMNANDANVAKVVVGAKVKKEGEEEECLTPKFHCRADRVRRRFIPQACLTNRPSPFKRRRYKKPEVCKVVHYCQEILTKLKDPKYNHPDTPGPHHSCAPQPPKPKPKVEARVVEPKCTAWDCKSENDSCYKTGESCKVYKRSTAVQTDSGNFQTRRNYEGVGAPAGSRGKGSADKKDKKGDDKLPGDAKEGEHPEHHHHHHDHQGPHHHQHTHHGPNAHHHHHYHKRQGPGHGAGRGLFVKKQEVPSESSSDEYIVVKRVITKTVETEKESFSSYSYSYSGSWDEDDIPDEDKKSSEKKK